MTSAWARPHHQAEARHSHSAFNVPGIIILSPSCRNDVRPEAFWWDKLEQTWDESWHFGLLGPQKRQEAADRCRTSCISINNSAHADYRYGYVGAGSDTSYSAPNPPSLNLHLGSNGSSGVCSQPYSESQFRQPGAVADCHMGSGLGNYCSLTDSSSTPFLPPHAAQAVPLLTKRQCQESQEPGQLGTWAGRQVRLLNPILEKSPHYNSQPDTNPRDITASSAAVDVHARQARPSRCAPPLPEAQKHAHHGHCRLRNGNGTDVDPDAEGNAAWRWRFARRWHAERARVPGPDTCGSSPDTPEQALCLLRAGGGMAWESQASQPPTRTASMFSIGSATWDLLLEDGSLTATGPLSASLRRQGLAGADGCDSRDTCDRGEATAEVSARNRKAVALVQQQAELERAAEARWRGVVGKAGGESWVGSYLEAVELDGWGTFRFVLLRLRGQGGRQRVLLRGRNLCREAEVVREVSQQVGAASTRHSTDPGVLEVMGGGVMEWRRERDNHLHIRSTYVAPTHPTATPAFSAAGQVGGGRAGPATPRELLSLAAVMAQQQLPAHFRVTCEGA